MSDERRVLIDDWFPIDEVGVESIRERSASSALPPLNFLHVWFARRPLVTSRAGIITSVLNYDYPREKTIKLLGIPPDKDLVALQKMYLEAKAQGRRTQNPFTWPQAYKQKIAQSSIDELHKQLERVWGKKPVILDPMAGGGSIPYEAVRLGFPTIAGDLNPVAYITIKATVEYPVIFGEKLVLAVKEVGEKIHQMAQSELVEFFPKAPGEEVHAYLWSRIITCSNCSLQIPMSPHWWIVKGGKSEKEVAIRLIVPENGQGDECDFEIINNPRAMGFNPDQGTDVRKEALCPRCGRVNESNYVKSEAQAGRMGHQLYAVCIKIMRGRRKRGIKHYRKPRPDELKAIKKAKQRLHEKIPEWEKQGIVPNEKIVLGSKTRELLNFGMYKWIDLFNPRQLLTHLTYLEKINLQKKVLLSNKYEKNIVNGIITYLGILYDGCISYNSLLCRWDSARAPRKIVNSLALQGFPFKTSYAEFDHSEKLWPWIQAKTLDALKKLINYLPESPGKLQVYCGDSANIPLDDKSVECIVVDPPYFANVMYAEVSDFFYVWLKRIVGNLYPEAFQSELTEKRDEAVANIALFRDVNKRGVAKRLATQHYEAKMESCFRDMNRVLRDDGVLTVMFTHRESEAWASLANALINSGFTFTSSWPVFTEPGQKFGKANKGVLKVTVLLSCRKREAEKRGLWERVIQELYDEAERKVMEHSKMEISGPDLLVSVYGPVLGKFANYSIVRDATGRIKTPRDALTVVAEVVNRFLTADLPASDMDTLAYLNLIREFPGLQAEYDLARLTTVFGGNVTLDTFNTKVGKGLIEKKGNKVNILTAHQRHAKGIINPNKPENLRSLIDVVHASIIAYEQRGLPAVTQLLRQTARDTAESGYIATLRAIAQTGTNNGAARSLANEARTVSSLLEALGHRPEVTRQRGESLDDYFKPQK